MLNVHIICVGRVRDKHLAALCDDFQRRLRRYLKVTLIEVRDERAAQATLRRQREATSLLAKVPRQSRVIAMSENGVQLSSKGLAKRFRSLSERGTTRIAILVGGPDGLADSVTVAAHETLSLSPMTFTHEMARYLLLEQIYRAMTILKNEPYHRA